MRGIHRSLVDSSKNVSDAELHFFICAWTNGCANNTDAGDLRRHRAHYDVTVMNRKYPVLIQVYAYQLIQCLMREIKMQTLALVFQMPSKVRLLGHTICRKHIMYVLFVVSHRHLGICPETSRNCANGLDFGRRPHQTTCVYKWDAPRWCLTTTWCDRSWS